MLCRPQLVLHRRTVASMICTPRDNGPIAMDGGKCRTKSLDLLHIFQLLLHTTTVATAQFITPSYDRPITHDRSKCVCTGLDLLHVLKLVLYSKTAASIPSPR